MNQREITTLMHKLFYGDIPQTDGWVHLMEDGELIPEHVMSLLDSYIEGDELLLFVDPQHCTSSSKAEAFAHIKNLLAHGNIKIADPHFRARVLINSSVGVGVGSAL